MPLSNEDAEVVTFPLVPQMSQRASSKRKKLFDIALLKMTEKTKNRHVGPEISRKPAVETDENVLPTMRQSNDWGSSILTMLQQMDLWMARLRSTSGYHRWPFSDSPHRLESMFLGMALLAGSTWPLSQS